MRGNQTESMVVLVLLGHRIPVLPVDVHEDGFNDHPSVSVVENLLDVMRSPHFDGFLPLPEIPPLVLEKVLHGA